MTELKIGTEYVFVFKTKQVTGGSTPVNPETIKGVVLEFGSNHIVVKTTAESEQGPFINGAIIHIQRSKVKFWFKATEEKQDPLKFVKILALLSFFMLAFFGYLPALILLIVGLGVIYKKFYHDNLKIVLGIFKGDKNG